MTYANYADLKKRKPLRRWHDDLIEDLIVYPMDTLAQRSERFKRTVSYLSIVMNSDMFKAAYEARRQQLRNHMDVALTHKLATAANKSMDILLDTIESKRDKIPFRDLAEFTDKTLQRLGYGLQKTSPQVAVQLNNVQVTREDLAQARSRIRQVEASFPAESLAERSVVEEGEVLQISPPETEEVV